MNMPKLTLLLLGLVMVLAFQNCGNNMSFQQEGSLVAKADVDSNGDGIPDDPTSDDPNNSDDNNSDDSDSDDDGGMNPGDGSQPQYPFPTPRPPGMSPNPTPRPGTAPGVSPTPRPGYGGGGQDDDGKDCNNKDRDEDNGGNHAESSAAATFICILEGPGKSVKLGLRPNSLSAGTSADQAVCMSQNACLNIASKAFSVKMADRRGFCDQVGASGRVILSDRQMEEAVTKAKVLQMSQE